MAVAIVATAILILAAAARPASGISAVVWAIIVAGHRARRRPRPVHGPDREDDRDAAAGVAVQRGRRRRGRAHRHRRLPAARRRPTPSGIDLHIFIVLDIIIGSITFTGSLIASGKLQGLIPGKPIIVPGGQLVTLALAGITVIAALFLFITGTPNLALMLVILAAALIFGVTMTLPIGGADMPVVISLLNSFTGTAVAMAGLRDRQPGADHRRRPRRRIGRDPDQAHGRRHEPLGPEHHDRRVRRRRRRGRCRGRARWLGALDRRRRRRRSSSPTPST